MEVGKIRKIINSDAYNFLRSNEHLCDNIILLTLGGSYAYGTNTQNSDIDLRGIALESEKELLGLANFEQFENKATDTVIYSLRKAIKLLLNCNPNVIEMLATEDKHLIMLSEEGKMLRDNIGLFLSKRCIESFGGYATSQLKRIENGLARDKYEQVDKEEHILNNINRKLEHLKNQFIDYTKTGSINLYLDESQKEEFEKEIFMDIKLEHFPFRDFKVIYDEMNTVLSQYGKINSRNKRKSDEALLKHAMHLIRLLEMGTEILEGKGVHTYRQNREFLMDIRNGKYYYDDIFELAGDLGKKFRYAADNTDLPPKPRVREVEDLVIDIYRGRLNVRGT